MFGSDQPAIVSELLLTPLERARIELFNNGWPPAKGTQFGMVIDINSSAIRFNINFPDLSDGSAELGKIVQTKPLTGEEYTTISNMLEVFKAFESRVDVVIGYGKYNIKAGQFKPNGKPDYKLFDDYRVWVLFVRDPYKPTAILFYGDRILGLEPDRWEQKMTNAEIKAINSYGNITHQFKTY